MELIWLTTAYAAGLGAKALKLPVLVGFLAAGLILSLFGVMATETLIAIGDFGVIFLLFTVGLHMRVKSLVQPEVLGAGAIHMVLSIAIFAAVLLLTGASVPVALLMAVGLGFSSTVLAAKSLEGRGELAKASLQPASSTVSAT